MAPVTPAGEMVHLAYVNPETGAECLPVLGFSAIMLRPGETAKPPRRSASAVLHVVEGEVEAQIDGVDAAGYRLRHFGGADPCRGCDRQPLAHRPAFLFQVDDAPMQRKLGFYEVFH